MENLIITVYEFSVSFIPFIITMIFFHYLRKKHDIYVSNAYYAVTIVFAFYIISVFHFTGAGTLYDGLLYKLEIKQGQLNFVSFSQSIDIVAYLQNVLLFMPFGFLMPFICNKKADFISILYTGFGFSLLIEISQLLNNRRTDIDDIILNTLGAVIGFAIYNMFIKITKLGTDNKYMGNIELFVFIAIIFMSRFLLFNEIGIAKLIYKF